MYFKDQKFSSLNFVLCSRLAVVFGFLLLSLTVKAQIPVEVMAGNKQIQHQFFFFKDLDANRKVNLFSMARFNRDYEEEAFNTSLISSQLTYNLTPNWGISTGASFINNDLSPLLAISYTYFSPKGDLFLSLFPSVLLNEKVEYELSGIFMYTPKINEELRLFTQAIFATTLNGQLDQHLFSNQQFRVGISYKEQFQIGIGLDQSFINTGESHLTIRNIGVFLRKEL